MAGYIGSKTSVTQVDGYNRTEADAEFVNDPNSVISVSGSSVGIGTDSPSSPLEIQTTGSTTGLNITSPATSILTLTSDDDATAGGPFVANIKGASNGALQFEVAGSERMRVDAAGRVTMPYQPAFRASLLVGTPTAYIAGARALNFTDVVHNIGGHYDGTNKFTAPVAGLYRFSCDRALNTQGQDQVIRHPEMSFFVNGAVAHSVNTAVSVTNAVTASGYTHFVVNMGTELYLNANDYVQVQFNYGNSPSVLYEYARSYFSGYLIG